MLLTLNASCLKSMLLPAKGKKPTLDLLDLPAFTFETLGLAGFTATTELLAGSDRARLERLRERGDKAGSACLQIVESDVQDMGSADEGPAKAAAQRMSRVLEAAQILGCSSAVFRVQGDDADTTLLRVAQRLRPVVERAEKLDINLLISPHAGLTSVPERLTDLLKRVGGFRIGTFPDLLVASQQKDPVVYLRRLTPYASGINATTTKFRMVKVDGVEEFDEVPVHEGFDLKPLVGAIASVGYDGTLAIDYRGPGDVTMGVVYSRTVLQAAMGGGDGLDLSDEEFDEDALLEGGEGEDEE